MRPDDGLLVVLAVGAAAWVASVEIRAYTLYKETRKMSDQIDALQTTVDKLVAAQQDEAARVQTVVAALKELQAEQPDLTRLDAINATLQGVADRLGAEAPDTSGGTPPLPGTTP